MKRFLTSFLHFAPDNGSGMHRLWTDNEPMKSRKLFALLFTLLFVGVGNAWGAADYIIPKLYLSAKNTPSGNTGWTFTSATANNAGTDYWKMVSSSSVVTSPAFDISGYTNVTVSIKWGSFGSFNKTKCNATVKISTAAGTWTTLGKTGLTGASTSGTVYNFSNVEESSSYSSAQIQISTPSADGSIGGRLYYVEIKGEAAGSCDASPTVGNADYNGALVYSSTPMTVPITCPSIGAGSSCEIKDYGFVWKAGGNPSISDNKTQIGTDNHSTAFSGNISGTFAAGTTYYVKAYAINNGDNTTLSTGTYSFTPRSITFNSNGGSSVSTILVISGKAASQPADPTKDGYIFGGWYTDSGLGTAVNWSSTITSNKTYYAKWIAEPTITISETSRAFGDRKVNGGPYTMTFNVSGANLTNNISLSISGTNAGMFSVTPSSLTQSAGSVSSTEITVSYSPTSAGSHSATINITSSGATSKTVALSGTGKWEVTWSNNGATSTTLVENSTKPTFPSTPSSCDATSTTFIGWATAEWDGKIASLAGKTVHTSNSTMSNITANGTTFYAVFAKQSGSGDPTWVQTTSVAVDDVVVIAEIDHKADGKTGKELAGWGGSTYGTGADYTTTPAGTITWTVVNGYNSTGVAFKNSSNNYLYWSSSNSLDVNSTLSANSSWSVSTESSRAKIQNNSTTTRVICWNEANPRFAAYDSKSHGDATSSGASTKFYYPVFYKQTPGYTYSDYLTTCCTALGSINGSVNLSNEDCNPGELKATWKMTATTGIASQTLKVYDENLDEVTAKRITDITASTSNQTKTISGLDPCKEYMVTVENVSSGGEYCAAQAPWESDVVATLGYTITYNTTNISLSSGTEVANSCAADDIDVVYAANDGYHLPTSITVTNAGDENDNWTWDAEDGEFIILDLSAVTGDVEVTITAELDACDDYSFFYGTSKGFENNFECFSQVGTSTTWLTGLWTIPSADQWTYVGEPNWDASPGKSANLQLSNMPYALNHANNLGSISSGVMEGAQGYIQIYSDRGDANRYVGFIPAGYVFRWGSGESWTSYPFTGKTNAIEEEDWNTALQTWTSSNADDFTYVGLKTSSGYVWANRSETRRPVFFKPNANWLTKDGESKDCKFAMYYYTSDEAHNGWSAFMEDVDGDGIYEAWIPNNYEYAKVIFVRFPNSKASTGNWDNEMNQTGNLSLQSDKNVFTMAAGKWGTEADEGSWSLYDKKGTFHISANSNTNNWYCHFLPHHVLTYNANGGSGAPDVQSVAINASPCQITVAAGSGMTPPTGYSFIGWNPDESEADAGNVDSDYDPNDTPTMSGDITLYAVWQANSIALTLDKNNSDASGSSNGSGSIDYDATSGTITTAATRTGYHVEGYYAEPGCTNKVLEDDGDVINSTVSGYTSSGKWARTTDPTTLYTKWTANEYTISLDDQSATTSASISSITVTFNANTNLTGTVVATRPTKTGYQFGGYYTGTSGSGVKVIDTDGTVVAGVSTYTDASKNWIKASDVDLYAYWLPIYAITWSVNGSALTGDALDGASTAVVSGGTISGVPSTAPADNTLNNCANIFMGWSTTNIAKGSPVTDDDDIAALGLFTEASGYTTAISGATTFYAVFAESNSGTKSLTHDEITSFYCTGDACGGATNAYKNQTVSSSDGDWSGLCCSSLNSSVNYVNIKADLVNSARPYLQSPTYSGQITNIAIRATHGSNSTRTLYICSSSEASPATNNIGTLSISKNNESIQNVVPSSSTDKIYLYSDGAIMIYSITVSYGSAENYVTQCADNQVRVTYNFNGGTGTACTEGVTTKSASYTVCSTEPEKDYYDFAGWNDGTDTYDASATYNLQATTEFTAQWTPTVYTITYNLNGGTQQVTPAAPTSYTYESSAVTLPTPTKNHDRFDGWFDNSGLTGSAVTTIAAGSNGNKEYWAKWTTRNEIKFYKDDELLATIYRAADENLQASVAGQGSKPDDPSAPSACSSKVFMGWTETWFNDETNTAPADLNDATGTRSGAKTYYAVWATRAGDPGSYTYSAYSTTCCSKQVTLSDGSPSNGTVTFNHDFVWTCKGSREVEMTVTPNSGYYLSAWSTSGVTPTSVEPAISYGSVSDNGAQVATVTFAQNTTAGTYTASATFTPIPVSSLALTVQQTGQSDKVGNDLTMNCYPKEGQTGGNDPLNHTLKVNFTEVLPSSALDKTVDWSVRVKATGDADWTDVGFTGNALNTNSIINSYNKSTGNLQIKATEGTAEIKITAHDGSGVTAKVTITVTNVALSLLNVAKSSTTLYVGESEEIAVTYDPVNTTTKGYTTGSYSYVTIGNTNDVITLTGKAATSEVTERVTLTSKDAGAKTATIDVTVKPLPTITFVDLIHNKTDFANSGDGWTAGTGVLSSTAAAGVVSHLKKTPTHADLAEPATGNACEKGHLHLVGWIRSDFSKVVDYLDGTGAAPSISDLTTAGATYWFLPDASINVETLNGKMFYAVWAVEDEL